MTGEDQVAQALQQVEQRIRDAAAKAVFEESELILAEAVKIVPIEEGPLQNSGRAQAQGLKASIGFGSGSAAPYAIRQHEDMTYRHDAGRQAKYLEQPFIAARSDFMDRIREAVRRAL